MKNIPPQQLKDDIANSSDELLHQPVLLDEVLALLAPKKGETYLDLTAGYGGHARAIISHTQAPEKATLVDRDQMAISELGNLRGDGAELIHKDFLSAAHDLVDGSKKFDMILADLGVSSPQLNIPKRGFSFRHSGPLDMRMDASQVLTADTLVNTYSEEELMKIIYRYGQEPQARRIAKAICVARPLKTTDELAALVERVYRGPKRKIHPATRTFQAIRIAVNEELKQVEQLLPLLPKLLNEGGRIAIISFHSLEDKLVKQFFHTQTRSGYESEIKELTKKPVSGESQNVYNPRARSAKLRAAVKIKMKGLGR